MIDRVSEDSKLLEKIRNDYKNNVLKRSADFRCVLKYGYLNEEKNKELKELIVNNIKDILRKEYYDLFLRIAGIYIKGLYEIEEEILGIKFELTNNQYYHVIPLDKELKTFFYIGYNEFLEGKEKLFLSFEELMKKIREHAKLIKEYGYFLKDDYYWKDYVCALEKYDNCLVADEPLLTEERYIRNIVGADLKIEKINLSNIKDKKLLSNIYLLKYKIGLKKSKILINDTFKEGKILLDKALEYNSNNINAIIFKKKYKLNKNEKSEPINYMELSILLNKYKSLADTYYYLKNYEGSIEYYEKIIDKFDLKYCRFSYKLNEKSIQISDKKLNKNIKKEIYTKIIDANEKVGCWKKDEKEIEKLRLEFEN